MRLLRLQKDLRTGSTSRDVVNFPLRALQAQKWHSLLPMGKASLTAGGSGGCPNRHARGARKCVRPSSPSHLRHVRGKWLARRISGSLLGGGRTHLRAVARIPSALCIFQYVCLCLCLCLYPCLLCISLYRCLCLHLHLNSLLYPCLY